VIYIEANSGGVKVCWKNKVKSYLNNNRCSRDKVDVIHMLLNMI
jgi:hypothetical protein